MEGQVPRGSLYSLGSSQNDSGERLARRAGQAGVSRVQNLVQNLDHFVKQDITIKTEPRPKREVDLSPREVNEYRCPQCKKKLQCQARVLEHMAAVHEEQRIYDCFFCDVTYKYKSNLRAHIKKKHTSQMNCPKCPNRVFVKFDVLVKHLMEAHNDKSQAPLKFWNYDQTAQPIEKEKTLDPGVPIAKKTITHNKNGNGPNDKPSNPGEPARRNIAFKTIVPLKRKTPSDDFGVSRVSASVGAETQSKRPKIIVSKATPVTIPYRNLDRRPIEDIISTYSKPSGYSNPASNASSTSSYRSYGSSGLGASAEGARSSGSKHSIPESNARFTAPHLSNLRATTPTSTSSASPTTPRIPPTVIKRPAAPEDPSDPFYGLGHKHEHLTTVPAYTNGTYSSQNGGAY